MTRSAIERSIEHHWPADPEVNLETWRNRRGRDEAQGRLYESSTIVLTVVMHGERLTVGPCSKARDTSSDQNLDEGEHDREDHQVISGQLMGFRILGQKWAGRAKRATTQQVQVRKETTNARGLTKRANKR